MDVVGFKDMVPQGLPISRRLKGDAAGKLHDYFFAVVRLLVGEAASVDHRHIEVSCAAVVFAMRRGARLYGKQGGVEVDGYWQAVLTVGPDFKLVTTVNKMAVRLTL